CGTREGGGRPVWRRGTGRHRTAGAPVRTWRGAWWRHRVLRFQGARRGPAAPASGAGGDRQAFAGVLAGGGQQPLLPPAGDAAGAAVAWGRPAAGAAPARGRPGGG